MFVVCAQIIVYMQVVPPCLVFHVVDTVFNLVLRGCDHFDLSNCIDEVVGMGLYRALYRALYLIDVFLHALDDCSQLCYLLRGLPHHIVKSLFGRFHKWLLEMFTAAFLLHFHPELCKSKWTSSNWICCPCWIIICIMAVFDDVKTLIYSQNTLGFSETNLLFRVNLTWNGWISLDCHACTSYLNWAYLSNCHCVLLLLVLIKVNHWATPLLLPTRRCCHCGLDMNGYFGYKYDWKGRRFLNLLWCCN